MTIFARLRARRRCWLPLALPALMLRALIPAGFMPVAGAEGLTIGLCPDAGLPPGFVLPADPHSHHHHHQHSPGGGDPSSATHHAPCVFAASATLAPAPGATVLLEPRAVRGDARVHELKARPFVPSILRAQSPRAPPRLPR
jgi:hypothetical protein